MNAQLDQLLKERDCLLVVLERARGEHVAMPETRSALARVEREIREIDPTALPARRAGWMGVFDLMQIDEEPTT